MSCFVFIIINILLLIDFSYTFTCKDENNNEVDWYVLYKLPIEHNANSLIMKGVSYMYITSNDNKIQWKLSSISINNSQSIPGITLRPFYDNLTSMHVLYNDETPSGSENNNLGHTKGIVMSNDSTGFWLIHSVPHYPPKTNYYYPDTGLRYGQSFLCISLDLENLNNVGKQLQYNQPLIYKAYLANNLKEKLSNINSVINKAYNNLAPWYRLTWLNSIGGEKFLSFAKSGKFGKEIYKDWIAAILQSNLLVETWLNGSGRIPSDCSSIYQVNNIKSIRSSKNFSNFSSSKDHSKWAISNSASSIKKWICIGDINREEHQKQRGGGSVCISKQELWNEYRNIIGETESCKN